MCAVYNEVANPCALTKLILNSFRIISTKNSMTINCGRSQSSKWNIYTVRCWN